MRRFPWKGFLALLFTVISAASMVAVLVISNNKPVVDWTVSPAVYLAIISTIANILLNYALSEGVQVAWWVKSMKQGSNISDLHNVWAHGTSLKRALLSGRSFSPIALACMTVALAPINGPLLQRASTVAVMSHKTMKNLTVLAAQEFPIGYTGTITGRAIQVGFVTSNFSSVVQDYVLKRPTNVTNSGWYVDFCPEKRVLGMSQELGSGSRKTQEMPILIRWTVKALVLVYFKRPDMPLVAKTPLPSSIYLQLK